MKKILIFSQIILSFYCWIIPNFSFGQPGRLIRNFAIFGVWTDPEQGAYSNIGIQPGGKILVSRGSRIGRFNPDGSLDRSFANNGWKYLSNTPYETAIQPDGKILTTLVNKVNRYNVDGTADESFGVGGLATVEVFGFDISLTSIAIDSKNRIVVAGTASSGIGPNSINTFVFARLNSDGSLDTQLFGGIRIQIFGDGVGRSPVGCGVGQNDKIILGIAQGTNYDVNDFITRYNENGTLDTQFGDGGILPVGHDLDVIAVSRTGRVAYSTKPKFIFGEPYPIVIGCVTENGANTTLGTIDVDRVAAVEIQDDGKIVAAGSNDHGGRVNGLYVRRYNINGSNDQSFGEGGSVHTDLTYDIRALDIVFYNRRIYMAGDLILFENAQQNIIEHYGLLLAYDGSDVRLNCPQPQQSYNTDEGNCYATVNNINALFSSTTLYANVKYKLEYNGVIEEGEGSVSGRQFQTGTTKVTYSYTDVTEQTCHFDVVVVSNQIPVITCPLSRVVNADPGKCYAVIPPKVLGVPNTAGNCNAVTITGPHMPEDNQFPIGVTSLTWIVADEYGNTATCTQTVTVLDREVPTISIAAKNVSTDPGQCYAVLSIPDLGMPVASDNCTEYKITAPAMPLNNIFPKGTTQLIWRVTDANGNIGIATQVVTVTDTEFPKIEKLSATPNVLAPPNGKMMNVTINYVTSDNCGIASYAIGKITSNDLVGKKNTSVDWEYIDNHHVRLRAEKSEKSIGRIYTVTITCTDLSGNVTERSLDIPVHLDDKSPTSITNARFSTDVGPIVEETVSLFDVTAYPNPSYSDFAFEIVGQSYGIADVRIINSAGQEIESFRSNDKGFRMGLEWKTGLYIVEIVQGLNRKTIKVIKH